MNGVKNQNITKINIAQIYHLEGNVTHVVELDIMLETVLIEDEDPVQDADTTVDVDIEVVEVGVIVIIAEDIRILLEVHIRDQVEKIGDIEDTEKGRGVEVEVALSITEKVEKEKEIRRRRIVEEVGRGSQVGLVGLEVKNQEVLIVGKMRLKKMIKIFLSIIMKMIKYKSK